MHTTLVIVLCDVCGGRDDVTRIKIRLAPDRTVETDVCARCRQHASAVEVIRAGRPQWTGRPVDEAPVSAADDL